MTSQGLPSPGSPRVCLCQRFLVQTHLPFIPFPSSCYLLDLQTQPGVQGAFPLPLGLMGPDPGSPHSPGRWELVAWHHVGRPGHRGSRHQRRGKESHFSRAAISKPAAPTANPVWALFPTLVSLAPLADDPVPTLFLARLQGSPEVKSEDQGSPRIRWWVVPSLKCIQLPAWWGSPCPNYSYEPPWWLRRQGICLQCGRPRLDPWGREIPGAGNGNPFQYSCLEKSKARGAWRSTVPGVTLVGHD